MVIAEHIKEWIESGLPGSQATVEGDGHHFEAVIICSDFAEKGTLQRHRMVYAALGKRMGDEIHALSFQTLTPEEASKK